MSNANSIPRAMVRPLFGSSPISKQQRLADALAMDATDYEPNGAWTNMIGKAARGYVAGRMQDEIDRKLGAGAPIDIRPRGPGISSILAGMKTNFFGG